MRIRLATYYVSMVLFGTLAGRQVTAQVDTIFKYEPGRRLFNLWKLSETDLFKSADSARVFKVLDSVIDFGKNNNDERLMWYGRYFKILYNGLKNGVLLVYI